MTVIAQDDHLTAGAWATCVWIYLLQRPGGGEGGGVDRDTSTTFHLLFSWKVKFILSSFVKLNRKKNTLNGKQNYFNLF